MILVINTGSSSVKIALLEQSSEQLLAEGFAEKLGENNPVLKWNIGGELTTTPLIQKQKPTNLYQDVMTQMLDALFATIDKQTIKAVGHRVVHGGEKFVSPVRIDDSVMKGIQALSHLAPLHNPSNLLGIQAAMLCLPDMPHVAVFDTAFHHNMPEKVKLYAVPYEWYTTYDVRKYGFHGTSHHYVGQEAAKLLGQEFEDCKLLTVHLGNGCSATAIADGKSVDTTMGLTPLEGLVMGTRSGDVDPGLIAFMTKQTGEGIEEITNKLNKKSGLLGVSGLSNDMRTLLSASEKGNKRATLAIEIFCYRLAKSLASLVVSLGRVDAIVFTGGIGEHAPLIRANVLQQLEFLGITWDEVLNQTCATGIPSQISAPASIIDVFVIPTNEEKMIARYVGETIGL